MSGELPFCSRPPGGCDKRGAKWDPHQLSRGDADAVDLTSAQPRRPGTGLGQHPAHPCIRVRLPNGALYRWQFEKAGQPVQIDVQGPITLDEASLSRIAVLSGVGIGYFMEPDVRDDIATGRLVQVLEEWTPPLAPLCLYYPSRRNSSAAFQAFIGLAREVAAKDEALGAGTLGVLDH